MSFSENFKTARKKKKLTQSQVAEALSIDRSAVAHYENGTAMPQAKNIQKICDILDIPIEKLFEWIRLYFAESSLPLLQGEVDRL